MGMDTTMSYQLKIDAKSRKSSRAISAIQKQIQQALVESGKSQQEIAEILGVNRSVVNRSIRGGSNLTIKTISDLAFALNKDVKMTLVDQIYKPQRNTQTADGSVNVITLGSTRAKVPSGTIGHSGKLTLERAAS